MSIHEWRNYVKIRDYLLSSGCILFGGAVRDEIIHNMNATQFYTELSEFNKKNTDKGKLFEYSNSDISPHTIGRLLIPNDIDVFVKRENMDNIITYFTRHYKTQVVKSRDLSYFKDDLPISKFILHKIELMTKFNNKYFMVKIDLITYDSNEYTTISELPFDFDFDINSLFWSKQQGIYSRQFRTSQTHMTAIHNTIVLNDIYTNIRNKVAVMDDSFLWNNVRQTNEKTTFIKECRIKKLIAKGWTIKINFNIYQFHNSTTIDDTCIICLKTKNEFKACVNFKACNCKSYICLECIKKEYTKIVKCPSCRKTIMETDDSHIYARNEIYMYENFIMD